MEEKNNTEANQNNGSKAAKILKDIMSGKIFVSANIQKHLGYIFFLFFLALFYIAYRYTVDNTFRENNKLDVELKLLRTEYVYQLSNLTKESRKSKIEQKLKDKNSTLKETSKPFIRIKIK
ncbi:MAG: hypothetical protein LBP63_10750 [Prevotellaceae bacterium]|jgi:hypothetical protein|nr:hypothetical protein [Prevotellaceae bacterium]